MQYRILNTPGQARMALNKGSGTSLEFPELQVFPWKFNNFHYEAWPNSTPFRPSPHLRYCRRARKPPLDRMNLIRDSVGNGWFNFPNHQAECLVASSLAIKAPLAQGSGLPVSLPMMNIVHLLYYRSDDSSSSFAIVCSESFSSSSASARSMH